MLNPYIPYATKEKSGHRNTEGSVPVCAAFDEQADTAIVCVGFPPWAGVRGPVCAEAGASSDHALCAGMGPGHPPCAHPSAGLALRIWVRPGGWRDARRGSGVGADGPWGKGHRVFFGTRWRNPESFGAGPGCLPGGSS